LSRARLLSLFVALIALASALSACGGGGGSDDPQAIVDQATLQGVESGKIDLALALSIEGEKGGDVDVALSGPFQSEDDAELPELDLSFATKGSLGGERLDREAGITLLPGNKAYVAYEGTEYEVDSTTFNFVKSMLRRQGSGQDQSSDVAACQKAASGIELDKLVENLKDEGDVEVGGTSTTKLSGDLNPGGAVEAFGQIVDDPTCNEQLRATGQLPPAAELDKAKGTVQDSLKSAHVDLYVGDDDIVRRIAAKATVEPPKGSDGAAKRIDLDLDLTLTGVNEEQTISAPSGAKPLSSLFLKLGINPIELLGAFQNGGGSAGLGGLLEGLKDSGGGSSSGAGGNSGGGRKSYIECLGEAQTPVDIQDCTGLLQ
jgi:predicted heme/steroid binding protein